MGSEDYAGWITFGTKIDNKYFEREIRKAAKELEKLDDKRKELEKKQDKIDIEFNVDKENLDTQYQKMIDGLKQDMDAQKKLSWSPFEEDWYGKRLGGINQWYEKELQNISGKHDDIKDKIETVNKKYEDTKKIMDDLIGKYNEFQRKNGDDGDEDKGSPISPKKLAKSGRGLEGIIKKVTRWGLALFGIRGAYSMIRKAMADISQENKQVGADIEYMRWAISKTLEPVIVRLVSWFMKLMQAINYVVYRLSGGKITLFAQATADNFKKASGSAKELQKTLAGFDEMNIVGSQSSGGGGGVSLPSDDLNNFDSLSDGLKEKLEKIVEILQPFWDILEKIGQWIKDHPQGFATILGGLIGTSVLSSIIGKAGVGTTAGTGLLGIATLLLFLTAEAWIIKVEWDDTKKGADELAEKIKEQNSLVEQSSSNWAELRYRMMVAAAQEKDNKEKSKELADAIFKMVETTDGQIKSVQEAHGELSLLGETVYLLTGNTDLLCESEKELTEEQKDNIEALKILYKNNMLNEEQKKRLEDRYRNEIDLLKEQREKVKDSNYETAIYTRRIEDLEKELGDLTGEEWDVKVEDVGTDETKQAIDEVGDSLDKIVNSDHTIEVKGNTSPFKKAVSGLLTNMGSTAFGLLFKGVGISFSSLLNKFKYAKGGIVNLPGYGVPIGGEAGREGVIPLTDEQQMQLLGESIGKYVTINLTNVTKLDSREINRKNEKVRSENTFIRNR